MIHGTCDDGKSLRQSTNDGIICASMLSCFDFTADINMYLMEFFVNIQQKALRRQVNYSAGLSVFHEFEV